MDPDLFHNCYSWKKTRVPYPPTRSAHVHREASWRSSSVMMPHGIPVSAPVGAGIRPWSRHPDSQCLETAIRSRAPRPLPCWLFRRGSLHSSHWKGASCSSLWTCLLRVGGYGTRAFSRNSNSGISRGLFLSRGMAVVLKASWRSSSVMMQHGIPVFAPDGAGIRPWSRHPDAQCLETAIRSRAP